MIRVRQFASVVALLGIASFVAVAADPTPIKKIMAAQKAALGTIGKELKGKTDWETVHKVAKDWVPLAEDLGKNDAPKGEKASWEKLTKAYAENVAKLEEAAGKKDAKAVGAATKAIQGSCGACHKAHKP
jgi:cytochrome c556